MHGLYSSYSFSMCMGFNTKGVNLILGKNEEESKNKLQEIQEMKERLKQENDNLKQIKHKLKEIQEKQKLEKEVSIYPFCIMVAVCGEKR